MELKNIRLKSCRLNLGELHKLKDFEFFNPEFVCIKDDGEELKFKMRLHISEPLDHLVIADPAGSYDLGYSINSVSSSVIKRKTSFTDKLPENVILPGNEARKFYILTKEEIMKAVLNGYNFEDENKKKITSGLSSSEIAFTCHDPNIIGGGNTILFRLINWLSDLGIEVTVYSCGKPPSWLRVNAKFKCFTSYNEMFSAINEEVVILYSMWHIEPMLKANPNGKSIYHIRQIYEPFHYGTDFNSMVSDKPVIKLLESLPIGSIAISPHLKEWYKKENGIESILITNGINLKEFYPVEIKKNISKIKTIVSVGSPLHFVKGANVLAAALSLLAKKNPAIKYKWLLASGEKGNLNIPTNIFPENLQFEKLGGLDRNGMRELYNSADVAVNPSLYEGFGLPTLEAMACGVPVVHANNKGLDFIIEDNKDCLVVPINDYFSLADAIERLLNDKELSKRISEQGLKTAAKYSLANQFEMFNTVFEIISNNKFKHKQVDSIRKKLNRDLAAFISSETNAEQDYKPLVSVVIPSYNQAEYLKQAFKSLFDQTYTNWEAIVVNDGSTDNTKEVMAEFAAKDSRIKPVNKENGGITSALNEGIKNAKGDYFCWLSSDDLFYPEKIEAQINAFNNLGEDYALVYGSFDLLQEETQKIDVQPFAQPIIPGSEFPEALKFDFIDGCTIMIRMDVMREVGGFNSYYRHSQDMELWIRIASRGYKFHLLNKKLTIRRIHYAQSSTGNMIHCRYDAACMINYYLEHFSLLELYRYFDLNNDESLLLFVKHFVGRMMDTEANINHPLIQDKFWKWFSDGVDTQTPARRGVILRNILMMLINNRNVTPKVDFYINECYRKLLSEHIPTNIEVDYSVTGRNIRYDNRENDPFNQKLFDYGTDLLVNSHIPLFAQELYFHNTNKVVDTPYKLAHSVFRYLSQFPNQFRDRVKPISDLSKIPQVGKEAVKLFCLLRYPEFEKAFNASLEFKDAATENLDSIKEAEEKIAKLPEEYGADLKFVCSKNPTSTILFYWCALILAGEGKFAEALNEGRKTLTFNHLSCDWRIAFNLGNWAEKAGKREEAFEYFNIGYNVNPNFPLMKKKVESLRKYFKSNTNLLPVQTGKFKNNQNINSPDVKLADLKITPTLNGNYILNALCHSNTGKFFNVSGTFPYTENFDPLKITDPFTKKEYKLTDSILYNFWTNNYNFSEASENIQKNILNDSYQPSVAFTIPNSSIMSGGTIIAYRYANWLSELGVETAIYSNDKAPDWLNLKVKFYQISSDAERYRAIKEQVIIVFSVLELQYLFRNLNSLNKRIFHLAQVVEEFHYHGFDFKSTIKPKGIFEILHRLPVGRIAISDHIHSYMKLHYGQRSELIINGIELKLFNGNKKKIFNNKVTVMTIGNPLRLLKGVSDLRQSLTILSKRNPGLNINLIVVSGQKVNYDFATDRSIHGFSTTFLTGLSPEEISEVYEEADIYVNASWYEGFGLPTLEAMASGLPVVQADNLGLDGVVKDSENCLMVPPNNPLKISEAIEKIINDKNLRDKITENAFRTASEFSLQSQYKMFVNAFENISHFKFDMGLVEKKIKSYEDGSIEEILKSSINKLRPKISVIIPYQDEPDELSKSVESVIKQNYENWEAVIVNYNPSEKSILMLERFPHIDRRIRVRFIKEHNEAAAYNEGMKSSHGEWINFLCPGEIFDRSRFSSLISVSELSPEIKFFYSNYYPIDGNNKIIDEKDSLYYKQLPVKEFQLTGLLQKNFIYMPTVAIHRTVIDEVGPMNENILQISEYEFWLRILKRFEILYINAKTCGGKTKSVLEINKIETAELEEYKKILIEYFNGKVLADIFPFTELNDFENRTNVISNVLKIISDSKSLLRQAGLTEELVRIFKAWLTQLPVDFIESLDAKIKGIINSLAGFKFTDELNFDDKKIKEETSKDFNFENTSQSGSVKNENCIESSKEKNIESSIIILTYNQLEYTKKCLESISAFTNSNYEIIILDNASTDGTVDYLKELKKVDHRVKIIFNQLNLGFPKAVNLGIKAALGKYVVIANNDIIVTKGWLKKLIELAESNSQVGLVGPISNAVSGVQLDKNAAYKSIDEMNLYAAKVSENNKGKYFEFPRIAFLCTLIKKDVISKIGGLDERFSPGNFEDDDFCLRAQIAGYKTLVAQDVFIHHFGSKSFTAEGTKKYQERLDANKKIFIDKWGAGPEEIWLHGKPFTQRSIEYPIDVDVNTERINRAHVCIKDRDYSLALFYLEDIFDDPSNKTDNEFSKSAQVLYDLAAKICFMIKKYDKAEKFFMKELEIQPNSSTAYEGLGDIYLEVGNDKEAVEMYVRSLEIFSANDNVSIKLNSARKKLELINI